MRKLTCLSRLLVAGGLLLGGTALAEVPSGEMLSANCAGCHGPDGISAGPASPTIAGLSKDYFLEAMTEYKEGTRPSTVMNRIATGYSEAEIERMAEHFANKEYVPQKQDFDPQAAESGAKLHDQYCSKCHEDKGLSPKDDSGILAGQWRPYLQYTMRDYLAGRREMTEDMAERVNEVKDKYGDGGFLALLHFYASQGEQ